MLSYSSVLVLGIIAEKSINPYEIKKLLEKISIRKWLPIATSSLYATIRTLSSQGLIECETAKEGNMPEKKVYTINEMGSKSLHEALLGFIGNMELDNRKTNIATLMICHLPKGEALEALLKKTKKLENNEMMLKRIVGSFENSMTVPYTAVMAIRHELYMTQAELMWARELTAGIVNDDSWGHFIGNNL